jgi:hypothetical protein
MTSLATAGAVNPVTRKPYLDELQVKPSDQLSTLAGGQGRTGSCSSVKRYCSSAPWNAPVGKLGLGSVVNHGALSSANSPGSF